MNFEGGKKHRPQYARLTSNVSPSFHTEPYAIVSMQHPPIMLSPAVYSPHYYFACNKLPVCG